MTGVDNVAFFQSSINPHTPAVLFFPSPLSLPTWPYSTIKNEPTLLLFTPMWLGCLENTWNLITFRPRQNTEALYQNRQLFVCRCAFGILVDTDRTVLDLWATEEVSPEHVAYWQLAPLPWLIQNQRQSCIWIQKTIKDLCFPHRWCSVATAAHVTSRSSCVPHLTFPGLWFC